MGQSHEVPVPAPEGVTGQPLPDPSDPVALDIVSDHPHDFDVQKRLHQQIRNDPDYDDWEYGTEPLPHEAWIQRGG